MLPLLLSLTLPTAHADAPPSAAPDAGRVRFLVLGDTGDACADPADKGCVSVVAASALARCQEGPACRFGLLLGDNFYETGVSHPRGAAWRRLFHEPFGGFAALSGFHFWAVPGNHDVLTPTGLAAQIAHTRSRANTDDLWRMLPLPYSVPVPAEASAWLHVTGFDSNPVINDTAGAAASLGAALDALPAEAGWNLLFAHHLLMSDAAHGQGDAEQRARLDRALAPRLGPGKAQVLLSGHDHVQQVLVHDDPAYIQVIEGNSSRARGLCATPVHPGWTSLWARGQAGTGCDHIYKGTEPRATGFMILDATPARLDLHAYDAAGCQLHHSAFALAEGGDLTVASDETAAPGACLAE